ncbi:hypothetical protein FS837_006262, partial [Tulasnella sp. UAMH 9824]
MSTAQSNMTNDLGRPVPYLPHAISVSMPAWEDNRGFAEGHPRVLDALTTGYPRFMHHESVKLLARICEEKFGNPGERCMVWSSAKAAETQRSFLLTHSPSPIAVRTALHVLSSPTQKTCDAKENTNDDQAPGNHELFPNQRLELHMVFFPTDEETFALAKKGWSYTGNGISSRRADTCLEILGAASRDPVAGRLLSTTSSTPGTPSDGSSGSSVESLPDELSRRQTTLLVQCDEQPLPYAEAKQALRQRIARALA